MPPKSGPREIDLRKFAPRKTAPQKIAPGKMPSSKITFRKIALYENFMNFFLSLIFIFVEIFVCK